MIRDTSAKRSIFEIIFYVFLIGFIVSLATFGGFALGGFQESFFSNIIEISSYLGAYLIYIPLLIVAILVIIFPIANAVFIKKGEHPATQEKPSIVRLFTVSYLYNPEQSLLWFIASQFKELNQIKWSTNIIRVLFLSVIIFGFIGLFQIFAPQLAVSGVPQTSQQVTITSDILFGSGIPSVAENGTLLFIYFFLLGIVATLCALFIKDKKTALIVFFMVGAIVVAPLMGIVWMKYHSIVYGNSEASLLSTFLFGWIGAELILLTGIFIWWFMAHFINNMILKLTELVTIKEDLAIYVGLVLFFIIVLYATFEILQYKNRKKAKSQEQQIVS